MTGDFLMNVLCDLDFLVGNTEPAKAAGYSPYLLTAPH